MHQAVKSSTGPGTGLAAGDRPRLDEQLRALVKAMRLARQRLTIHGAHVQPGTSGILAAIACAGEGDGCHPKELAARCGLDASTISRAVAALVERGLVRRSPDPADGRARLLTLTPAGRAALADVERLQAEYLDRALRDWTVEEVDAFAAALNRFVAALTAHLESEDVGAAAAHPAGTAAAAHPAGTATVAGAPAGGPAPEPPHDPSEPETSTLEAAL